MSESSPATGAATDASPPQGAAAGGHDLEIQLDPGTGRHFVWTMVRLVLATLFALRVGGPLGWTVGVVLAGLGMRSGWLFGRAAVSEAGVLALFGDQIFLPHGPSAGLYTSVSLDHVRHAYLVRRAVPWNTSGPILVVELDDKIMEFPRDWFFHEEDQRRVVESVRARKGRG